MNNENQSMRHAASRIFTWRVHNPLGKGVLKDVPFCAIWSIQDSHHEEHKIYTPFQ